MTGSTFNKFKDKRSVLRRNCVSSHLSVVVYLLLDALKNVLKYTVFMKGYAFIMLIMDTGIFTSAKCYRSVTKGMS